MSLQIQTDPTGIVTIIVDALLIPGEPYFKEFELLPNYVSGFESKLVKIDLFRCKYMDTKAISIILDVYRILKRAGKMLKLVNANEDISDLLHSIKLNKIIQLN